jgi:hypothetical protein
MDLSKAFDCLPYNLLLLKLEAYGLSKHSLKLLQSYLENRKQDINYYSSSMATAAILKIPSPECTS